MISMGEHLKIMAMVKEGYSPPEIGMAMGLPVKTIKRVTAPSWWQRHEMTPLDRLQPRKKPKPAPPPPVTLEPPAVPPKLPPDMGRSFLPQYERHITRLEIPPEVLAEHDVWEAEAMADRDLTAMQLGDPVPSRSALGRRGK